MRGMPDVPAKIDMNTAIGRALGSVYPPNLLKTNPPQITPKIGPVIAITENEIKAFFYDYPNTV